MAKGKMHISADGKARACDATVQECKLVHGETAEEARNNYEKEMEKKMGSFQRIKKPVTKRLAPLSPEQEKLVTSHVDRGDGWDEYYTATDKKHFQDRDAPGSKFTDPSLSKVEDVVALTLQQRGSLEGDDRDKLIARGAKPEAFRDGNRYLMVNTPGTLGVQDSRTMRDDDLVEVTRTKPGTPVNLVKKVTEQGTTNYGVVVVTKDFDSGEPRVITTFPGTVTYSPKNHQMEALEGKTITVAQAREILGDDFYANTRVVDEEEMKKTSIPAKPHPTYGFDTSKLTKAQVDRVTERIRKRQADMNRDYTIRLKQATPEERKKIMREFEDALMQEHAKYARF